MGRHLTSQGPLSKKFTPITQRSSGLKSLGKIVLSGGNFNASAPARFTAIMPAWCEN